MFTNGPLPQPTMHPPVSIDASLARFVRRAYFKRLTDEWGESGKLLKKAQQRNLNFGRRIKTDKALKDCTQNFERVLGAMLPISSIRLDANSRSAHVFLSLLPEPVPHAATVNSNATVRAIMLLRPSGLMDLTTGVVISGHAVGRVIQRCQLIELPISNTDMQAIHAEFADALPLACLACSVLEQRDAECGDAESINVLLPSAHGVFLANWVAQTKQLLVKTFVDRRQLLESQLQAVQDIARIGDGQVAAHILDAIAPGWLKLAQHDINASLLEAWRHCGWRFDIERLHPGMSDAAWLLH